MTKIPISVAKGDGIGPEIMETVLSILKEAGASIDVHEIEIGEKAYLKGEKTGISPKTWEIIKGTKALLKAPVTTPQGKGYKSVNVTIRTTLNLFANIRPCISYFPFIQTKHPHMDVVIIRENEEDLYCGIEYQLTDDVTEAVKIISKSASERIIRFAFEYARAYERKKVTCFTKDNILKISDGLFHQIFNEVAKQYPDIVSEHLIVDIGFAKLSDTPQDFDVIVLANLYGDILSDIAAQITGSIGLCGTANIGENWAMFEAIHGSAPDIARKDLANPSALLLASVLMLDFIGQKKTASIIYNAFLKTIETGVHTLDIFNEKTSKKKVGTQEFAKTIISHLGEQPDTLASVAYQKDQIISIPKSTPLVKYKRVLTGVDIYLYFSGLLDGFIDKVSHMNEGPLHLTLITNKGAKLWPNAPFEGSVSDQWRLRFLSKDDRAISEDLIIRLYQDFMRMRLEIVKTVHLYQINGKKGYSTFEG